MSLSYTFPARRLDGGSLPSLQRRNYSQGPLLAIMFMAPDNHMHLSKRISDSIALQLRSSFFHSNFDRCSRQLHPPRPSPPDSPGARIFLALRSSSFHYVSAGCRSLLRSEGGTFVTCAHQVFASAETHHAPVEPVAHPFLRLQRLLDCELRRVEQWPVPIGRKNQVLAAHCGAIRAGRRSSLGASDMTTPKGFPSWVKVQRRPSPSRSRRW